MADENEVVSETICDNCGDPLKKIKKDSKKCKKCADKTTVARVVNEIKIAKVY